ncbi:hypothetical protein [Streptomyces marincola]|uniref:hypothetical protein n=1 Tax=Streptomyces marincola TaxID=2878388 RepID=UPI001CF1B910|nr:hypothetical protein [Streptomyces marincola]UCM87454.1 hypothetical protein LC193_05565 [Streptomyces marincola]
MPDTREARASVTGALRALEGVLSRGGRRTALANAHAAVLEDRARAAARRDAERALAAVVERGGPAALPAPRT